MYDVIMQCNRKGVRRDNQDVTGIQRKQLPLFGVRQKKFLEKEAVRWVSMLRF